MANILKHGYSQYDLVTLLIHMNTRLAVLTAKLDGDGTVNTATYASGNDITFPSAEISIEGVRSQGAILDFLNDFLTSLAGIYTLLDADTGVTHDDFTATLGVTDIVDVAAGTAEDRLSQLGVRKGILVDLINDIIESFNGALHKLDSDLLADKDYFYACKITDTVNPEVGDPYYKIVNAKVSPGAATGNITFSDLTALDYVVVAYAEDLTANCYTVQAIIDGSTLNKVNWKVWKAGGTAGTSQIDFIIIGIGH